MKRIGVNVLEVFATALVLSAVAIVLVAATESGSRWLIERAVALSGSAAQLQTVGGTLLTRITIGDARFALGDSDVEIRALEIEPAWGASFVHEDVIIERLAAESVTVTTDGPRPAKPEKFTLQLPTLPAAIEVRHLRLDRLVLPNTPEEYAPALDGAIAYDGDVLALRSFSIRATAFELHGELSIAALPDLPVDGSVSWQWRDPAASGRVDLAGTLRELAVTAEAALPDVLHARGRIRLLDRVEPSFEIDVDVPELARERFRATGTSISVAGTPQRFDGRVRSGVKFAEGPEFTANAVLSGSLDAVDVTALSVESTAGRARATGHIERVPEPRLSFAVDVEHVDPGALQERLSGALSGHVDVGWRSGQLELSIAALDGTLNGAAFHVAGRAVDSDGIWTTDGVDIRSGPNAAQLVMRWDGERMDGRAELTMPDLHTIVPGLDGDLRGTFNVSGTPARPIIAARTASQSLAYGEWSVADARLEIDSKEDGTGHVRLRVAALDRRGASFKDIAIDARGTPTDIGAEVDWTFADQRGSVRLSGRQAGDVWQIEVAEGATLALPGEVWRSDRRIAGSAGRSAFQLSAHCWLRGSGAGRVCIDTADWHGESVRLAGQLSELPIAEVNRFVAGLPELSGSASGQWDLTAERGRWRGTAALATMEFSVVDRSDETAVHRVELPILAMAATVDDSRTTVTLSAVRDGARVLDLNVVIDGFDASAPLRGNATLRFDDVSGLATLSRRIGAVEGALDGAVEIAGTVGSPEVRGRIAMRGARLVLQDPHVELTALDVQIEMNEFSQLVIRGTATSSGGHVEIDGVVTQPFDARRHFVAHIDATRVAVDVPDADVEVSGRVELEWTPGLVSVRGNVAIPRAQIALHALPEGAVAVSSDVIVIDRVEQRAGGTRLQVDLELTLTDEVHFEAFGLVTNLDGRLRLRQSAEGVVQLNGTVALVRGTFTAYGQTLAIESGRLTYSGAPDNPYVDARATRTIKGVGQDIVVGAHVQGPARNIQTTLFSDPEMSEAQALAYLVLGRPLSGATAQQNSNVMGAAIALGLTGASPVIDEIRNAVGIDELTATGGTTEDLALVAGKRLSERVFVRYQYQTFTRTGAVLIELLLSRRVSLQATAGQTPAIDVLYRVGEFN